MTWYITCLICGLFLIGVEIFIPGGVIGILGALALLAAVAIGFSIFPPLLGWLSLFSILLLSGVAAYAWMKYFPKSRMGQALSLAQNITKKDQDDSSWTVGMKGITLSSLRPAGKATIDHQRVDVIADNGSWIEQNVSIEIIRVEGNRIYVKEAPVET
ncbi:MAG: hypothetical protein FJ220_05005 [Kiritimatiellaceae bacterium]|nr:hypothetical protein [Kiritimatiellaceae bacterium]